MKQNTKNLRGQELNEERKGLEQERQQTSINKPNTREDVSLNDDDLLQEDRGAQEHLKKGTQAAPERKDKSDRRS